MTDQEQSQKPYSFKSFLHSVYCFAAAIGVILAVGFSVYQLIDSRIEQAINNEQFIRKVASHIRPYVIFDENESILMDGGAMQYLEKIEVGKSTEEDFNIEITVTPKHHLSNAPLIEILSKYEMIVMTERGRGHQWIYKMRIQVIRESGRGEELIAGRFRLEILR